MNDLLEQLRSWYQTMESGYINDHGAALTPYDCHNLMCVLDEARTTIEKLRVYANE